MILPLEIITDVLLRLPAKSLLRFKNVCKLWYELIKDPYFVKLHLERSLATKSNLHFVFKTPVLHLADFDTFDNPIELNYPCKTRHCSDGGVSVIGSCHGLLCLKTLGFWDSLCIYNPTTQTYKTLPIPEYIGPYGYIGSIYDYGFGYDSISEDYKLVRMNANFGMISSGNNVMVYSMKDNIWRTTPNMFPYDISLVDGNVFLNDTIHWVRYQIGLDQGLPLPIVAFHLSDESFSTFPLPNFDAVGLSYMVVGVLDDCLCLSVGYHDEFSVWIMKDYGMAGSWTKLFRVANRSIHEIIRRPLCYSMNFNKLFVNNATPKAASMDLEKMDMTYVKVGDFYKCTNVHLCVENLLMLEGRGDTIDEEEQHVKKKCKR